MNIARSQKKPWIIITITAISAALLVSYLSYGYFSTSLWPFKDKNSQGTAVKGVNEINYDPPTKEDKEQSQEGKKNSAAQDDDTSVTREESGKQKISIGISFADIINNQVEVRAFTPNIIEGGGICTAKFTKDNQTITATSEAFVDSTSSQCNPIYVDPARFTEKGTWNLVVSYLSNNATGTSEKMEINL